MVRSLPDLLLPLSGVLPENILLVLLFSSPHLAGSPVSPVPHEVSELEVEDLDGMEEVGEESREYCKSDMEFGRGRSRLDFCRMNLESL